MGNPRDGPRDVQSLSTAITQAQNQAVNSGNGGTSNQSSVNPLNFAAVLTRSQGAAFFGAGTFSPTQLSSVVQPRVNQNVNVDKRKS